MKTHHSFNFRQRKFGNDISNKENLPNIQEKRENRFFNLNNNKNNSPVLKKIITKNNKIKNNSSINLKKSFINDNLIINENNKDNPQYVNEYSSEIIKFIIENESLNIFNYSKENIYQYQNEKYINEEKRKKIIQILIYYNFKWKLNPDNVYLTVNIMDRYTSKIKIKKDEYELIALASYLIGSKYEDIYSPNAKTLSYIFSFKYNPDEILQKEKDILNTLNYSLLYQSSFKFLHFLYYCSGINDIKVYYLSQLFLDLSLTDLNVMKFSQRKRAAASFIFAKKIFGINSGNFKIIYLFSVNENELKKIIKELFFILKDIIFSNNQNLIADKFKSSHYGFIFSIFERKLKEKAEQKKKENISKKIVEEKRIYNELKKNNSK